jgi:hypothetical protein
LDSFVGVDVKGLASKLISMGCDDNSVFQDTKIGVTIQVKEIVVPFMIGVHCFAHYTNLAMFGAIEIQFGGLVRSVTTSHAFFFSHSFKKFFEFQKVLRCVHRKRKQVV